MNRICIKNSRDARIFKDWSMIDKGGVENSPLYGDMVNPVLTHWKRTLDGEKLRCVESEESVRKN